MAGRRQANPNRRQKPFGDQQRYAAPGEYRAAVPPRRAGQRQPGSQPTRVQRLHAAAAQAMAMRCSQPEQQVGQRPAAQPAQRSPRQTCLHRGQHRARDHQRLAIAPQHHLAHMAAQHPHTIAAIDAGLAAVGIPPTIGITTTITTAQPSQQRQFIGPPGSRALLPHTHFEAAECLRQLLTQRASALQPRTQRAVYRLRFHRITTNGTATWCDLTRHVP